MKQVVYFFVIFFIQMNFTYSMETQNPANDSTKILDIYQYINNSWDVLSRNNSSYFKHSAINSTVLLPKNILYISRKENADKVRQELQKELSINEFKNLKIKVLPSDISKISIHGLLYLPYPYVVPGGRFDEMFGWDSYFIVLGLIRNGRLSSAKNMIENIIYEINHYGTILNANHTYFIQRSQPPLLTQMILVYYEHVPDKVWLKSTLPAIKKLYDYWMKPPRYIPEIGLSRYYAGGQGPTPEELPSYYKKVKDYFRYNNVSDYNKSLYYNAKRNQLTALFYIADRTVRESGFDISAKFGPFSAGILDYVSVDLNVLLYQTEKDTSLIYKILGHQKKEKLWQKRAARRAKLINKYMWNDSVGYYFDYNFKTKFVRPYVYATTFYPLWAGIASKSQAERVFNNVPNLLAVGGLVTSTYMPKLQWDAPFGWAPFQYFAVKGLANYGYNEIACDIAKRFINTVNVNFEKTHLIYEKYDVQNFSIKAADKINYGYNTNEIGFGWTNGVYLELTNFLGLHQADLIKSISPIKQIPITQIPINQVPINQPINQILPIHSISPIVKNEINK
jgi:alpha,alpha-trehalase